MMIKHREKKGNFLDNLAVGPSAKFIKNVGIIATHLNFSDLV